MIATIQCISVSEKNSVQEKTVSRRELRSNEVLSKLNQNTLSNRSCVGHSLRLNFDNLSQGMETLHRNVTSTSVVSFVYRDRGNGVVAHWYGKLSRKYKAYG